MAFTASDREKEEMPMGVNQGGGRLNCRVFPSDTNSPINVNEVALGRVRELS